MLVPSPDLSSVRTLLAGDTTAPPLPPPPAPASLAICSLLNLALDWAKSKSESGTSTFAAPPCRTPRPRPRPLGALLLAFTRISLTFFVKLSMAVLPLPSSCAIAKATAALAALVASSTLLGAVLDGPLALALAGLPVFGSWNGFAVDPVRGSAGVGRVLRLVAAGAGTDPFFKLVATAFTSSAEGLDSTGGFGALTTWRAA